MFETVIIAALISLPQHPTMIPRRKKRENRIIIHVDMDHFFTAIEGRGHPEYKGQPVVVGDDPKNGKGRGVVSTCDYEVRKFGMKSGMPISKAWKRCRTAVYLPVNFNLYGKVSSRIMSILRNYADKFEQFGIDEAFARALVFIFVCTILFCRMTRRH